MLPRSPRLGVFLIALSLSCASTINRRFDQALQPLIGQSKAAVIDTLGPPNSQIRVDEATEIVHWLRQDSYTSFAVPEGQVRLAIDEVWITFKSDIAIKYQFRWAR